MPERLTQTRSQSPGDIAKRKQAYEQKMEAEEAAYQRELLAAAEAASPEAAIVEFEPAAAQALEGLLADYTADIRKAGKAFDNETGKFDQIPQSIAPFTPPRTGIGALYLQTKEPLHDTFLGLRAATADQLTTQRDAQLAEVQKLASQLGEVIDVSTPPGSLLVFELTKIILTGSIRRPKEHFRGLIDRLQSDLKAGSQQSANSQQSALRLSIISTRRAEDGPPLTYAAKTVLALLRDGQLSALFRYFATHTVSNYFADAPVLNRQFCVTLAPIIQQFEFKDLEGEVPNWERLLPPVPVETLIIRIEGAVDAFLRDARTYLLTSVRPLPNLEETLIVVAHLLVTVLLQEKSGEIASLTNIAEVISRAVSPRRTAADEPPDVVSPELSEIAKQPTKEGEKLVYALFANGVVPELVRRLGEISPPWSIKEPAYWGSRTREGPTPVAIAQAIARAFAPIATPLSSISEAFAPITVPVTPAIPVAGGQAQAPAPAPAPAQSKAKTKTQEIVEQRFLDEIKKFEGIEKPA
jgi:hypothetical protein